MIADSNYQCLLARPLVYHESTLNLLNIIKPLTKMLHLNFSKFMSITFCSRNIMKGSLTFVKHCIFEKNSILNFTSRESMSCGLRYLALFQHVFFFQFSLPKGILQLSRLTNNEPKYVPYDYSGNPILREFAQNFHGRFTTPTPTSYKHSIPSCSLAFSLSS